MYICMNVLATFELYPSRNRDYSAEFSAQYLKFLMFDTDVGTDDAWALLMLLKAERELRKIKVLAVTCVHGNTEISDVVRNVFRVLDTVNRSDIRVFKGASSPLLPPSIITSFFHGKDGFGDIYEHNNDDQILSRLQQQHAVSAMYEMACKYPKQITFISVGPLTNLALCIKMYPDFPEKVKEVFIMGGNRKGVGNITACAEFNFYFDPEAAFIVMHEDKFSKSILPWEPCLPKKNYITLEWRLSMLSSVNNDITKLLDPVEKKCYESSNVPSWCPCDAFLVAAFLFPKLIIRKEAECNVSVELTGSHTRGQMIIDHMKSKADNARVIEAINLENFKKIALWTAKHNIQL